MQPGISISTQHLQVRFGSLVEGCSEVILSMPWALVIYKDMLG